jgi:hypothetical protein
VRTTNGLKIALSADASILRKFMNNKQLTERHEMVRFGTSPAIIQCERIDKELVVRRLAMKRYLASLAIVLLAGVGVTARAQGPAPASQQPEEIPVLYPPAPQAGPQPGGPQQAAPQTTQNDLAAARVSFIHGDVTTQRGDTGEWVAATLNTPVLAGDKLSTGTDSRAELQLDNANILRIADNSTANIASFSPTHIQLQVGKGLVTYDVLDGSQADVEIDTPNASIHPQMGAGTYRITVNSDSETIVDIRKGSADVSTPEGSTHVDNNQRITVEGAENAQYQISNGVGMDEWDQWNTDRDHTITSAASWQHTNPYYVGSQDLDPYGQWQTVPAYGSVWVPTGVAPGWAPYRDGRWVFEPYYGWTWVSYEPWGWAPYHYGRWFVYGGNWVWWPGPVYAGYRPIWAPAYVSFIGFGGGRFSVGVGFGFGSVGWLPIGPGDYFHPWYGRGVTAVNVVSITNIRTAGVGGFAPLRGGPNGISNLDRAFTDDHVRSGVSSMSADQFGRGRVSMQQTAFDANTLRQGSVMTSAVPVAPTRASMRPSDRAVNPSSIPNRTVTRQHFFTGSAQSSQAGNFNRGGNVAAGAAVRQNIQAGNGQQNGAQQNGVRPGFQRFGGSGNSSPAQGSQRAPASTLYQQGNRTGSYTPPSSPSQPNAAGRTYQAPAGNSQPNNQQTATRASYSNAGSPRPALQVQQPIVTRRSQGASSSSRSSKGGSSRSSKSR